MAEKNHTLVLSEKNNLKITGLENVISITENEANIVVNGEILNIKGSELRADKLSIEHGEMVIVGSICSLKYEHKKEKQGFFRRILK